MKAKIELSIEYKNFFSNKKRRFIITNDDCILNIKKYILFVNGKRYYDIALSEWPTILKELNNYRMKKKIYEYLLSSKICSRAVTNYFKTMIS